MDAYWEVLDYVLDGSKKKKTAKRVCGRILGGVGFVVDWSKKIQEKLIKKKGKRLRGRILGGVGLRVRWVRC